jgi:hypothetical protein
MRIGLRSAVIIVCVSSAKYALPVSRCQSGKITFCVTCEVVTMPPVGRSWIAGRDGGKAGGVAESFPIAFGDFGVTYFVESHLIKASVVLMSMPSVRITLLGWKSVITYLPR